MRILLDHNTPAPLRYVLVGHSVDTAYERGWARLTNGELIRAAESAGFDLFVTRDKGFRYQQNWSHRTMMLLILSANDWIRIRKVKEQIRTLIDSPHLQPYTELDVP